MLTSPYLHYWLEKEWPQIKECYFRWCQVYYENLIIWHDNLYILPHQLFKKKNLTHHFLTVFFSPFLIARCSNHLTWTDDPITEMSHAPSVCFSCYVKKGGNKSLAVVVKDGELELVIGWDGVSVQRQDPHCHWVTWVKSCPRQATMVTRTSNNSPGSYFSRPIILQIV